MGKIVMSGPQNVSLDGVVQDPDGEEGFRPGGWFVQFGGKDLEERNKVALDDALGAEVWLLGRRSYEFFGVRWRPRSGELADKINSMPKYVASSTLEDPEWNKAVEAREGQKLGAYFGGSGQFAFMMFLVIAGYKAVILILTAQRVRLTSASPRRTSRST
jgi:dihydrofolate reductase